MKMSGNTLRRGLGGAFAGCLLGGAAAGLLTAPTAAAQPCDASAAIGTISSVAGQASQYLSTHPGANQVLSAATAQSPEEARASVRAYFTANPGEYLELKGITAPLSTLQGQCGTAGVPMNLVNAFNEFQAG